MLPFNHKIGVSFLLDSVGKKPAAQMVAECAGLGLQSRTFVDVPFDLGIRVDKGYHFTADVSGTEVCLLEVLEHSADILQAKLMLVCKRGIFNTLAGTGAERLFSDCKQLLDLAFGKSTVAESPAELHQAYTNRLQQAYLTIEKTGKMPVIHVGVGNRAYWG